MTQPSQLSLRKLRHSIRRRSFVVMQMTAGVPGATKDQQIMVLDQQIKLIKEMLEKAEQARELAFIRDFDDHQAAKAQEAQQTSMANQTFDELVASLSSQFDAKQGKFVGLDGDETPTEPAAQAGEGEDSPF